MPTDKRKFEDNFIQFKPIEEMEKNYDNAKSNHTTDELKKKIQANINSILDSMTNHSNVDGEMKEQMESLLKIEETDKKLLKDDLVKMFITTSYMNSIAPGLQALFEEHKRMYRDLENSNDHIHDLSEALQDTEDRLSEYEDANIFKVIAMKLGLR